MMNSELARKLQWLGRRQRNRIWLNRVLRYSAPLFVYCASVFFFAGSIHQLLLPLNFTLVAGVAMVPSLLSLCHLGIAHKPAPREGAAEADKRFAANSLFVSAWELTRFQTDIEGTGKLLLERCEKALPDWSQATRPPPRANLKPAGLITITLTVLGLFFLLQPSHVQPRQSARTAPDPSLETVDKASADAAKMLSELLDDNANPTARTSPEPAGSTTPVDSPSIASVATSEQSGQSAEAQAAESITTTARPLPTNDSAATLAVASPT